MTGCLAGARQPAGLGGAQQQRRPAAGNTAEPRGRRTAARQPPAVVQVRSWHAAVALPAWCSRPGVPAPDGISRITAAMLLSRCQLDVLVLASQIQTEVQGSMLASASVGKSGHDSNSARSTCWALFAECEVCR